MNDLIRLNLCRRTRLSAALLASLFFCGCSSPDEPSGFYRVVELAALDSRLRLGDETRVDIHFTTKVFNAGRKESHPADVVLLINLPGNLEYIFGSARLYSGDSLVDSKRREPDLTQQCTDRTSFLSFSFTAAELEPRGPAGDGSRQKLRIQLRALNATGSSSVQASAGPREAFSCVDRFQGERSAQFVVE